MTYSISLKVKPNIMRRARERIGGHAAKKYGVREDPLERESRLSVIKPRAAHLQAKVIQVIDDLLVRLDDDTLGAKRKALTLYKTQLMMNQEFGQQEYQFVLDFWKWLLGRGLDEDHDKTGWGRTNVAAVNREVGDYVSMFVEKRSDYIQKLALLAMRQPVTLNEYYLYFKYIVRGGLKRTEENGTVVFDFSDEDFLQDWDILLEEFDEWKEEEAKPFNPQQTREPYPYGKYLEQMRDNQQEFLDRMDRMVDLMCTRLAQERLKPNEDGAPDPKVEKVVGEDPADKTATDIPTFTGPASAPDFQGAKDPEPKGKEEEDEMEVDDATEEIPEAEAKKTEEALQRENKELQAKLEKMRAKEAKIRAEKRAAKKAEREKKQIAEMRKENRKAKQKLEERAKKRALIIAEREPEPMDVAPEDAPMEIVSEEDPGSPIPLRKETVTPKDIPALDQRDREADKGDKQARLKARRQEKLRSRRLQPSAVFADVKHRIDNQPFEKHPKILRETHRQIRGLLREEGDMSEEEVDKMLQLVIYAEKLSEPLSSSPSEFIEEFGGYAAKAEAQTLTEEEEEHFQEDIKNLDQNMEDVLEEIAEETDEKLRQDLLERKRQIRRHQMRADLLLTRLKLDKGSDRLRANRLYAERKKKLRKFKKEARELERKIGQRKLEKAREKKSDQAKK